MTEAKIQVRAFILHFTRAPPFFFTKLLFFNLYAWKFLLERSVQLSCLHYCKIQSEVCVSFTRSGHGLRVKLKAPASKMKYLHAKVYSSRRIPAFLPSRREPTDREGKGKKIPASEKSTRKKKGKQVLRGTKIHLTQGYKLIYTESEREREEIENSWLS